MQARGPNGKLLRPLFLYLLVSLTSPLVEAKPPVIDNHTTLTAVAAVFTESLAGSSRLRIDRAGNYYVLNNKDSVILMYDSAFRFLKRISSFGQGPDDLNHPSDFTIDRDGQLVIADTGNNRIKIMSVDGHSLGSFEVRRPLSVDALSTGEILVVDSVSKNLINVFSRDGKLQRSFGELIPTDFENAFPALHVYVNRGRLFVDEQDNTYWTGNNLVPPTVRKYSQDGKLLLEIHPAGPSLQDSVARAKEKLSKSVAARTVSALGVLNGAQVDSRTGDIWVLPAVSLVQNYDSKGHLKREIWLATNEMAIGAWGLLVLDDHRFVVSNQVVGCYLFKSDTSVRRRKR